MFNIYLINKYKKIIIQTIITFNKGESITFIKK